MLPLVLVSCEGKSSISVLPAVARWRTRTLEKQTEEAKRKNQVEILGEKKGFTMRDRG